MQQTSESHYLFSQVGWLNIRACMPLRSPVTRQNEYYSSSFPPVLKYLSDLVACPGLAVGLQQRRFKILPHGAQVFLLDKNE